jgi:hypothetical protein
LVCQHGRGTAEGWQLQLVSRVGLRAVETGSDIKGSGEALGDGVLVAKDGLESPRAAWCPVAKGRHSFHWGRWTHFCTPALDGT